MRQVMVDAARRTKAEKRGGGLGAVPVLEDGLATAQPQAGKPAVSREEVLTLDAALKELRSVDERQALVVDYKYFLGMTVEETAAVMQLSSTTVEREWRKGREFLARRIDPVKK
jgi:RNA polymerase sigma factor (TIGR02999 family)